MSQRSISAAYEQYRLCIETGKYADFVITNADYSEKRVFIGGKEL